MRAVQEAGFQTARTGKVMAKPRKTVNRDSAGKKEFVNGCRLHEIRIGIANL
jgi:hypothetical protein